MDIFNNESRVRLSWMIPDIVYMGQRRHHSSWRGEDGCFLCHTSDLEVTQAVSLSTGASWCRCTVKTVATEIPSPKLTEFKSVYVAFQVGARFQQLALTEISGSIQSFFD